MNFYPHHIGDFLKDTNFLSNEEQMIYLKLIWLYYDTEQPLPDDTLVLSMKCNCRDKETELNGILGLFFKADGDTWRHTRCDAEIAKYHDILTERSKAGKASAVQRALKKSATSVEQVLNTSATNGQQSSTNQEPRTKNQVNPISPKGDTSTAIAEDPVDNFLEIAPKVNGSHAPICPHQAILDLYHEKLPQLVPVRVWNETRRRHLQSLWRGKASELKWKSATEGIEWFDAYFHFVGQSEFLTGKATGNGDRRPFVADLEWIIKPANFAKVIEGKYHT